MSILNLDTNSLSVIFEFLHFRDGIKICMLNKQSYKQFIILCYTYSFVPINLKKNIDIYSHSNISFELFLTFCENGTDWPCVFLRDQIRNADCLKNVTCIEKLMQNMPKKLKHINFGKKFNIEWSKKFLPNTVEHISFHEKCKFNSNMRNLNMPSYLKKISFGRHFNKSIDYLPNTVEIIFFCKSSHFNKFIKKYPTCLRELYLGDNYNKPLILMPNSVKIIHFSNKSSFNSEIQYPTQLEKIYFGKFFNQSLAPLSRLANLIFIKFN